MNSQFLTITSDLISLNENQFFMGHTLADLFPSTPRGKSGS